MLFNQSSIDGLSAMANSAAMDSHVHVFVSIHFLVLLGICPDRPGCHNLWVEQQNYTIVLCLTFWRTTKWFPLSHFLVQLCLYLKLDLSCYFWGWKQGRRGLLVAHAAILIPEVHLLKPPFCWIAGGDPEGLVSSTPHPPCRGENWGWLVTGGKRRRDRTNEAVVSKGDDNPLGTSDVYSLQCREKPLDPLFLFIFTPQKSKKKMSFANCCGWNGISPRPKKTCQSPNLSRS